jgi:hypothetical protein
VAHLGLWLASLPHMPSWLVLALLGATLLLGQVVVPAAAGADPGAGGDPAHADPGEGGADPNDAGGDPDDGEGRAAAAGDEDDPEGDSDEDDDRDLDALPEQNIRTRYRRSRRTWRKVEPLVTRLRTDDGRYITPRDLDDTFQAARDMREIEQLLEGNPDLMSAILDARAGRRPKAGAAAEAAAAEAFNEAGVPFDTTDENGKFFLQLARDVHEMKRENTRLREQLGQVTQRDAHRTVAQIETAWKGRTLNAVRDLPEEYKLAVVNVVQARFDVLKAQRQLHRVRPDDIIAKAIEPYRRYIKGRTRAAAAGAQARATNNQQRPGAVTRGTSAARSTDTNSQRKETIRDARKSFFARVGGTPSPGGRT